MRTLSCGFHARFTPARDNRMKEVTSMHKTIAAGAAAGAIGGLVFAGLMRLVPVGAEHALMNAFTGALGLELARRAGSFAGRSRASLDDHLRGRSGPRVEPADRMARLPGLRRRD